MKFELETTAWTYNNANAKEALEKLGFKFEFKKFGFMDKKCWVKGNENPTIEISTLEELVAFVKEHGSVVFDANSIEIYDDYRE